MNNIEKFILQIINKKDYELGLEYDEDNIYMDEPYYDNGWKNYVFSVFNYRVEYNVHILKNKERFRFFCDCSKFYHYHSCEHLAACLISYSNEIFETGSNKFKLEEKSKLFLNRIKNNYNHKSLGIKKQLKLVSSLNFNFYENRYRGNTVETNLKVKIGDDKLYILNKKFWDFIEAYYNEEKFSFGVSFTYDPDKYYFSKKDEDFLRYLETTFNYNNLRDFKMDDNILKQYLEKEEEINVDNLNKKIKVKNGFFYDAILTKEDNYYRLNLQCNYQDVYELTSDFEYIWYQNNIYRLNYKERKLYRELRYHDLNELLFDEQQFLDFKNYLLPFLKKQITVDESVPNLVISKEPKVSYYFDLESDYISAKIVFDYDGFEVLYNQIKDEDVILRDEEFENKCFEEILKYGFKIKKDNIVLEDIDDIADFLDVGLEELGSKYPVYTSEKLKETNIIKKPKVSSTFHLGMNQILNYHLDLEGVEESELLNIFASLKQKKKYYRLKSGDIIDINSEEIKELEQLQEELQLDYEMDGKIPKFRALYLDSLKEKSNIIETDDTFNDFINNFKEYKNCKVRFTKEEKEKLRDYQIEGVKWLYTIYKCGFGGILADEMGLGKSFQTIVFLRKILEKEDKVLIVVPTSLVYNWEEEFNKFGPEMKYHVFAGIKNQRLEELKKYDGNIYITSYGLLKEDFNFYKDLNFKVMIIDEAQAIKNPMTDISKTVKRINATAKFALTGTPIENSVIELWNIFDFIMPGFLGNITNFSQKYKMKEEFDDEVNELLSKLKKQIKPFLLRRKKSDVAKELPDKIENTIIVDLEDEQKKIYAAAVEEANLLMNKAIENGGFIKNKMIILSLLTKLRQICITPAILFEDYQKNSSKIEELIKVVKECILNGHKILLFTSFKTALEIVKKEFTKNGITSYTIAGDVKSKTRMELVNAFNNDDTNVFLIMLKSGGTGLNLTSADVVIHLDLWWNPQAENQATDRTHRIGQTKVVDVIKIVCKDTVEERILELQERKKQLSDKLIENGTDEATFIKSLTEKDIRDLLTYENE